MSLERLLIVVVVLCIVVGLFGRGRGVEPIYPGSVGGLIVLLLILGWLLGWFR